MSAALTFQAYSFSTRLLRSTPPHQAFSAANSSPRSGLVLE